MKNINYLVNGVLAVAVIILFVLHFSGGKSPATKAAPISPSSNGVVEGSPLPVAYINMDSLLLNYSYAKDLNEMIMRKEENARANINQQANQLQSEAQDFQKKIDNNAFLTRDRAQQEQQRLLKKQQDLQSYSDQLSQDLASERQRLMQQLNDSLLGMLKVYNQTKHYQIIFSNISNSSILLADHVYDITNDVVAFLNKKYSPSSVVKK
ncbi:MAG: OmpH family outer membrane protein [Tannerella sp.]|jgi:outer membrane protein|nr:OmpH family outer membrane protein [Tannerella sp.]